MASPIDDAELLRRLKMVIAMHPQGGPEYACAAASEGQWCCVDYLAELSGATWSDEYWVPPTV